MSTVTVLINSPDCYLADSTIASGCVMEMRVVHALLSAGRQGSYGMFRSRHLCDHTLICLSSLPAHHPCTLPCHAPATCDETEACRTTVYLTCPCGRIRQPVACGRSISNPAGREGSQQLKCSNECLVAKRNARLADALGIDPNRTGTADRQVAYNDELLAYAKANHKFCLMVEKSFAE